MDGISALRHILKRVFFHDSSWKMSAVSNLMRLQKEQDVWNSKYSKKNIQKAPCCCTDMIYSNKQLKTL